MPKRKKVKDIINYNIGSTFFTGDIKSLSNWVDETINKYKDEYDEIHLEDDIEYAYYPGESNDVVFNLIGIRDENDKEYNDRVKKEKTKEERLSDAKRRTEKRELAEYKRLKKKFEK